MDKFEVIYKLIESLIGQREGLLGQLGEVDFGKMHGLTQKIEYDMQINKIDARIDALLAKLTD